METRWSRSTVARIVGAACVAGLLAGQIGLQATAVGYGLAAAALAFLALLLLPPTPRPI